MVELPWELEVKILSLTPTKSLTRFRSVCKRWNTLFNDKPFVNNHLSRAHAHPQFIVFAESKIFLVDVNLDGPSIEVHNLPPFIPGYRDFLVTTVGCCDGLLMFSTFSGTGICNPWLRQIRWNKSTVDLSSGIGYDNSRPDKQYKIFRSWKSSDTTLHANIIGFESNATKSKMYEFPMELYDRSTVSLNGTLYWIAYSIMPREHYIQTFDFSTERFEFYCNLPTKIYTRDDPRSLDVYRGDRFSYLEKLRHLRNIQIWVTKKKIKNKEGEAVEWMKFMNVSLPEWSSFEVFSTDSPSYFIDDKSISLVMCCYNKKQKATIYIAKGDKFNEIKINDLVEENHPLHHTYFPSLVQVPMFTMSGQVPVESCFTLPKGVEASNGVGGNEWDDGFFDRVVKIYVGQSDLGCVFVKFDYIKDNTTVAGAGHWNAITLIPEPEDSRTGPRPNEVMIAYDDYIEAIEGTYTESQITSITFQTHKKRLWPLQCGLFNGKPFVLQGQKGSKIIGFYGRSSGDQLTALGVHLSSPS
ncbi:unnamed protein product [Eruca vesicaria subsp. sativa]|uniref:F-box domain-containing protein n=1 Tax=Eruca vesicaria subsp. sativa TaxID=29727 RepID=A0ABC8L2I6_ERUVS|nr:unnamed protein product [Eruca vesicaria subsp. sativa]